ncbi:MAG: sulfotransferase [Acidimicrobiia bacterium]
MDQLGGILRRVAGQALPRHRRWRRLLRSLPLDPDQLPRPLEAPSERDFIICGCSRTGTSLLSAVLFRPPNVVTVMEPWDGMRLSPAQLFQSLRAEIGGEGMLGRGRLDLHALREERLVRWSPDGATPLRLELEPSYLLGVKWPIFWRYLELLPTTRFLVCLRHPLEVIASFKRTGGRLAQGLDYETAFNRAMNEELGRAASDPAERRVLLYDYVHSRLLPHLERPNVMVVRFERWFDDPAGLLGELGDFLGLELSEERVALQPPPRETGLSRQEVELIRRRCTTAGALGYPL